MSLFLSSYRSARAVAWLLVAVFVLQGAGHDGRGQTAVGEELPGLKSRLEESLRYLSSDELDGRGPGTAGIDKAAEYLSQQFSSMGLKIDHFNGQPYQPFEINSHTELGPAEQNQLVLIGKPADGKEAARIELALGKDFNTLAVGGNGKAEAPLVFVGYGITAKRLEYDDYEGLDVKGKVVIMIRKEPEQQNSKSVFNGTKPSRHAFFSTKVNNAYEHGAAAIIFVNDRLGIDQTAKASRQPWEKALNKLVELRSAFAKTEAPTEAQSAKHRQEVEKLVEQLYSLKQKPPADADKIPALGGAGSGDGRKKMPVFFARRAAVDQVVKAALGESLDSLESKIDEGPKPQSQVLEGWSVACQANLRRVKAQVKNVVAVREGFGSLADETIIVGAHYDHLGQGGPGSLAPWTKEVHNGADDNASGTAALLQVAKSLSQLPDKPRRRLVFIAFSAEERGLLGSKHYVDHPLFSLENTVGMVNLDMVGRLNDNKLIISGTGTASEFDGIIDRLNKTYKFNLTKDPGGFGPSDHATFYRRKIPVLHFFTGTHSDYHRPSDDHDKINFEGMLRITQMVTDLTTEIVQAENRPTYKTDPRLPARGNRPVIGAVPDTEQNAKGLTLADVTKDGPCARAGIQGGDVLVKLGDAAITGIADIEKALQKHKPGDKVKIVVIRDEQEKEFTVKLDPAR